MTDTTAGPVFALKPKGRGFDIPQAMKWVRQTHGKGALRQFLEIADVALSRNRLGAIEYYLYGMFRQGFDKPRRRTYVTQPSNGLFAEWLTPSALHRLDGLIGNKVLTTALFERAGLPIVPIRAVFGAVPTVPGVRALRDADAIAAYLAEDEAMPCFGKPVFGTASIGAVSIVGTSDGGGTLHLGDGRTTPARQFAEDIARHFPQGYLFQPLLRQHPAVEALNGPAVGVLRVVTILAANGPEPLYGLQRLPPPGVMSDGSASTDQLGFALVDLATGTITRAQNARCMCVTPQTVSLATGAPVVGVTLPFIREALAACVRVHGLLSTQGQLGHDIALTAEGPILTEINSRPYHILYQRAADRGFLNPDFTDRLRRAANLARISAGTKGLAPDAMTPLPKRLG